MTDRCESEHAMLQALLEVFEARGYHYRRSEDGELVQAICVGKCGAAFEWMGGAEEEDMLSIVLNFPIEVPVHQRALVLQTIARVNSGLCVGKVDMCMETGLVSVQAHAFYVEGDLMTEVIGNTMACMAYTAETTFPALMGVMFGDRTPEEAVRFGSSPRVLAHLIKDEKQLEDLPQDLRDSLAAIRAEFLTREELDAEDVQLELP